MRTKLILAVTSPSAFLKIGKKQSIEMAMGTLTSFSPLLPISIAVSQPDSAALVNLVHNPDSTIEIIDCDPTNPVSFAAALSPMSLDFDAVLIHDASRPLTSKRHIEEVLLALNEQIDAIRPAIAFTETLKVLTADSVIKRTLDRSTVLRISTPELIRVSAIDFAGSDCGWFLPLKKSARTAHVEGSIAGLRINNEEDRDLMELHSN